MKDISLIVPAFNEIERIQPTLETYYNELKNICQHFEMLVVDDGSTDGTANLVLSLQSAMPAIRLIRCPENRGKGNAVRLGMLAAQGKIRIMTDADGSIPAEQVKNLILPLLTEEAEIVIGSRYIQGAKVQQKQPFYRRLWSRFANKIIQRTLLPGIKDTQCGFKAFKGQIAVQLFELAKIEGWSFDLELLALANIKGFRIKEVPVIWSDDERSNGKFSQLPKTIAELFKIQSQIKKYRIALG